MSRPIKPPRCNATLQIEYVPPGSINPMPGAPRKHPASQIRSLVKSIKAFGFNVPILIDGDQRIIAGHARVEAAKKFGMDAVPVIRVEHLSEGQVKAFIIADNRLAELSTWDEQALGAILLDLSGLDLDFDLEATGFAMAEIELRIESLVEGAEEETPPVDVATDSPITHVGDVWRLGQHILMCGNSLSDADYAKLMGQDSAALVLTDPPYNVPIAGHVSGLGRFQHREFAMAVGEMDSAGFTAFLEGAMRLAYHHAAPGSVHYWAMDWRHVVEIGRAGQAVYDRFLNLCVWQKNQAGMGSFYRSQHELLFVFSKGGAASRNNVQLGRFGRSRSNVWTYPSAASLARTAEEGNPLAMHPTVKPLALVSDILLDASVRGDIILDPFAGSGTSVIAADKLGRRARAMELDPLHCDTILRRWRKWSGDEPIRQRDGASFTALEAEAGEIQHE
ncbi:site-specific DNA-methyltransferase [Humitalea sp. 24SJ18S-53]|uniref:site-specific DNA-methyltransferase n=1 Tax=Humitalea sp. 24SJ18S-53 TaxID=3422307 RepID=UPI003D670BC9